LPYRKNVHVIATYSPPVAGLPPAQQSAVGRRGRFRPVRHSPDGETTMTPVETWDYFPFLECPGSHLTNVMPIEGSRIERRRSGRTVIPPEPIDASW